MEIERITGIADSLSLFIDFILHEGASSPFKSDNKKMKNSHSVVGCITNWVINRNKKGGGFRV